MRKFVFPILLLATIFTFFVDRGLINNYYKYRERNFINGKHSQGSVYYSKDGSIVVKGGHQNYRNDGTGILRRNDGVPRPARTYNSHFGSLVADYKYIPLTLPKDKIRKSIARELDECAKVGAYWIRPHITELYAWGYMENSKGGTYDWEVSDILVQEAQKRSIHVLPQLWTYSWWDRNHPVPQVSDQAFFVQQRNPWTHGNEAVPSNMKAYQNWLAAMVERYDGDGEKDMPGLKYPLEYYEILNEPNSEEDTDGFMEVTKASYETIKHVNPNVKLVMGGQISHPEVEKFIDLGIDQYVDVYNVHFPIEAFFTLYFVERGINKPIWITEIGYPFEHCTYKNISEEVWQAEYLVDKYCSSFAAGADKIFWIEILGDRKSDLKQVEPTPHEQQNACLFPEGKRPRLAYYTHKLLSEKIGNFTKAKKIDRNEAYVIYEFVQDRKKVTVLVNRHKNVDVQVDLDELPSEVVVYELIPVGESGKINSTIRNTDEGCLSVLLSGVPLLIEEK